MDNWYLYLALALIPLYYIFLKKFHWLGKTQQNKEEIAKLKEEIRELKEKQ